MGHRERVSANWSGGKKWRVNCNWPAVTEWETTDKGGHTPLPTHMRTRLNKCIVCYESPEGNILFGMLTTEQ